MNEYQISLLSGGVETIMGENYNADPVLGLQILDQFGVATKTYPPGSWVNLSLVTPGAPPIPVGGSDFIIDGDTR